MGLIAFAFISTVAIIGIAFALRLQWETLRELKNAHVNLAAEVGVLRREAQAALNVSRGDILGIVHRELTRCLEDDANLRGRADAADAFAKSLNERLVLLEIEKTAAPKPPEETPPPRRSFASQKARAEAGARK